MQADVIATAEEPLRHGMSCGEDQEGRALTSRGSY